MTRRDDWQYWIVDCEGRVQYMPKILPTHHCFDDALEFIGERVLEEPSLARGTRLVLVHAICLAPVDLPPLRAGDRFVHAWVEETDPICDDVLVWDAGRLETGQFVRYAIRRTEYRARLRVQDETRYTIRKAYDENVRSGHYGPWIPAYVALIRSKSSAADGPPPSPEETREPCPQENVSVPNASASSPASAPPKNSGES